MVPTIAHMCESAFILTENQNKCSDQISYHEKMSNPLSQHPIFDANYSLSILTLASSSIKVALALVLLLHIGRAVVFYVACRYYPRFLKPKRAGVGSRGGDDLFAVPIDDDDNDLDDDDDLDASDHGGGRANDIHRFPARATGAAPSRYDSDYESSDEDDYNDESGDAARDRAASTRPVRIGGSGGAGELGSLGGGGSEMAGGGEMSVQRLIGSAAVSGSSSSSTRDVADESQAAARLAAHASRKVTAADLDLFSVSSSASTSAGSAGGGMLRTTWGAGTSATAGAGANGGSGGASARVPIADDLNMLWEDATVVVSRK